MKVTLDSTREYTSEGYLKVSLMASKTGIQEYLASEIPVTTDKDLVSVLRADDEVFDEDSMLSWKDVDITNRHPDGAVTTDNFNDVSVGHITSVGVRRGNHVYVTGIIKDIQTIKDIENGIVEVSAGYSADYVTYDGSEADFEQKNIRINHLAIVPRGRAKTTIILDDMESVMEVKEMQEQIDALLVEVAELKQRPTIDAMSEFIQVTKDAEAINSEASYSGLTLIDIKRTALGSTMDGMSDDVVTYAFDVALTASQEVVEVITDSHPAVLVGAEQKVTDYRETYIANLKKGN